MTTPSEPLYSEKKRQERLAKKREWMKQYRIEHPESTREVNQRAYDSHRKSLMVHVAKWQKENPERTSTTQRRCHLRLNYGMTLEEWNKMFDGQGRRCAICRTDYSGYSCKKRQWDTDHDHSTGKIRGILCHQCNLMLGASKDNPIILNSAISYLIERP